MSVGDFGGGAVGATSRAARPASGIRSGSAGARALALAGGVAACLALRVLPFVHQVFRGPVLLYSDDPYYHLRRIELATRYWPRVPDFDSWISYPDGGWGIWAPLFDFVPATFSRFTGANPVDVAVFWPVLLGTLTALALYAVIRRVADRGAALLALIPYSFLPGAVLVSVLGRVDHHVAEVLFQVTADAVFLSCLLSLEQGRRAVIRHGLLLGLLCGLSLLTWAGSLLFLAVPAAVAVILAASWRDKGHVTDLCRAVAAAFVVATFMTLPFGWLNFHRGRSAFSPNFLSFLQPLLCVLLASAPIFSAWLARGWRGAATGRRLAWRAASAVVILAGLLAAGPVRHGLESGLAFVLGRQSTWQAGILESSPLLSSPRAFAFGKMNLSAMLFLLPFAAAGAGFLALRRHLREPRSLFAAVWLIQVTVLSILQIRFVYYAAPAVCGLFGVGIVQAWRRGRLAAAATVIVSLLLLRPALAYWNPPSRPPFPTVDPSLYNMLAYLRSISPPAGDFNDPWTAPAYGVLARWDFGYWVLDIAKRPVVATPFGRHLEGGGYEDSIRFFEQYRREDEAVALLRRRGCRYVITYLDNGPVRGGGSWNDLFARRLHAANGSDAEGRDGSGHFRLLAESPQRYSLPGRPEARVGAYKIFELVPGAVLRVPAPPGEPVEVYTAIGSPPKVFEYRRIATSQNGGTALIRVSYSGLYSVSVAGKAPYFATVARSEIEAGTTIDPSGHRRTDSAAPPDSARPQARASSGPS